MKAARAPRTDTRRVRLMVVKNGVIEHSWMGFFSDHLDAGDVIVVNDAATVPASLHGRDPEDNIIEIRLIAHLGQQVWQAVAFGAGNWLTPTEDRLPPPRLRVGDQIVFGPDFGATVVADSELSERLLRLEYKVSAEEFWRCLYKYGRPVQYSYMAEEVKLWSVQNIYSSRPWAVEMPSAGYAINWSLMLGLINKGVKVVALTHGAGISSTGDALIDAELPFAERFEIPRPTVDAVAHAKVEGHRVIAIGTSVVRALESAALGLSGTTNLKLGTGYRLRIVDGLLTGTHDVSESHYQLLKAFLPGEALESVTRQLEGEGYLTHEFGDLCLVLNATDEFKI